jgi:hypothetical protein
MFLAVDADFTSGHVRLWTGFGVLTIGGNTYLGMGELGRVESVPDRSNLTVERKVYQLAGEPVNPAVVSETDIDASFGRSIIEYLGFINNATGQLLATPEVNWEGEISSILRVDGATPRIDVNADNRMILLEREDGWRYTHQHQTEFYPDAPLDLGYQLVPTIDTTEILWGGRRVIAGSGGRGGPDRPRRLPY